MSEKKKRIGIVTIFNVSNFGAELQAYATQKAMQNLGFDAEIIDFPYYKSPAFKRDALSAPFYAYPLKLRIKETLSAAFRWLKGITLRKQSNGRTAKFERFHRENTRFSSQQFCKISELYEAPPAYDIYCAGSDQVWNPFNYVSLYPYFLTFAPKGTKKISYASSFGVSEIPPTAQPVFKACLNDFDAISVRELTGVAIVNKLCDRVAELVCDPTLLLDADEWSKVEQCVPDVPEDYLLVYELHPIPYLSKVAQYVARQLGVSIVRICSESLTTQPNVINLADIGPAEFVYLFRHAKFVVTNSFHGTAFSINMKRNFYCVLSPKQNNNSRQLSLLNICHLSQRVLFDNMPLPEMASLQIDYSEPSLLLDQFRSKSKEFINKSVNGAQ